MKRKIIIGLSVVIAVSLLAWGYVNRVNKIVALQQQEQAALRAPIEIPATGIVKIQEAENSKKPILAMFYVDWCTYCRRFMPIFGALATQYGDKYTFAVVNCEDPANEKIKEEIHIMGYPTLIIIDKQLDFTHNINQAATFDNEIMQNELEKYYKLRQKALK